MVTVAAMAPDVDGLGLIPELLTAHSAQPLHWYSLYHHALHSLLFALVVALLAWILTRHSWRLAALSFLVFHLHLLEDVAGSRGPDGDAWPIPYLFPFSSRMTWSWSGQWPLNAWPNFALTVVLLGVTVWFAVRRRYSPVSLFSTRADAAVVAALQRRFHRA